MSMISCKECRNPISSSAKACPHCGIKNKSGNVGCLALCVVGFLVFIIFSTSNDHTPDPEHANDWMNEDNSSMAYIMMQDFVESSLKAPSTAEFPSTYDGPKIVKLKDHKYRIESWVDAQNGFGAMIRTKFTCVVKQIDKDNWILISLKTD